MKRWEYNEVILELVDTWVERLDDCGSTGWELIGMIPDEGEAVRLIFKRRLKEVDDG